MGIGMTKVLHVKIHVDTVSSYPFGGEVDAEAVCLHDRDVAADRHGAGGSAQRCSDPREGSSIPNGLVTKSSAPVSSAAT